MVTEWTARILALSIAWVTLACVTTPNKKTSQPSAKTTPPADKAGTKPPLGPGREHAVLHEHTRATAELALFLQRQLSSGAAFTDADQQFIAGLKKNPPRGSLEEAALALGIIKKAANPPPGVRSTSFAESDLGKAPAPTQAQAGSLEALAFAHELDLASALNYNPWLASDHVARLAGRSLNNGQCSEAFRSAILKSLGQRTDTWAKLMAEIHSGGAAMGPPAGAATPEVALAGPADLKVGESGLADAQSLADRGEYKAAIRKAKALAGDQSPIRSAAIAKVSEFSNRAVQELRRQAAQAYQNSRPVADARARRAYLTQAKELLEQAVSDYPEATLLGTVRDNLNMIVKDLQQLPEGKG